MLVRVLDGIRNEAARGKQYTKLYAVGSTDVEDIRQARSRAYIHLYFKVKFGLLDFVERESYITDGGEDGGIDGYFIDRKFHVISLIQSKFRTTEESFQKKAIQLDEILAMDIKRVLNGEIESANGVR